MDITKSLTFYLDDARRVEKLGIGAAVVLISIILSPVLVGFAGFLILSGYSIRLLQNVRDGNPHPLPEWDRWSEDLAVGFKYAVALLVYALPFFVLGIPTMVGAAMMDSSRGAGIIGIPLLILGMGLMSLYGIIFTLATPAITLAFARAEVIRSAFDFTAIWNWTRDHIGQVVVVALVYLAASFVISIGAAIIGALLCVVGLIVTIPLATLLVSLVQYHLYGQLAHEYGDPLRSSAGRATPMVAAPADAVAPAADTEPADVGSTTHDVSPAAPADFATADEALSPADEPPAAPLEPPADAGEGAAPVDTVSF